MKKIATSFLVVILALFVLSGHANSMTTKGKVTYSHDGSSFKGTVELWDSDWEFDDKIGVMSFLGDFSFSHRKKQDPWWFGKNGRKGDFYIKVYQPKISYGPWDGNLVYKSKVYKNYKPPILEINVALKSYVYGKVLFKYPNGGTEILRGGRIVAKDEDFGWDDNLGTDYGSYDGSIDVAFHKSVYSNFTDGYEGKPDIYVNVEMHHDPPLTPFGYRIWRTRTYDNINPDNLPLNVENIEIPVIIAKGVIKSYKLDGSERVPSNLRAYAYDQDGFWWDLLLDASNVINTTKTGPPKYEFRLMIYGTRDAPPDLSDIYVVLEDEAGDGERVWRSDTFWDKEGPIEFDVNGDTPIEIER